MALALYGESTGALCSAAANAALCGDAPAVASRIVRSR